MKIFLINPDYMMYPDPPLGLCYIAGYIRKYLPSVEIRILDQLPEDKIIREITKHKPNVIGFSSASQNYYRVKSLAERIKKVSSSLLVIGGIHVTNLPSSFEISPFDIGILGEGELSFRKIIENIIENKNLDVSKLGKGFVFRQKGKIINTGLGERVDNLDDIPLPARDLLNMKYYTLPSFSSDTIDHWGIMLTSRGCPYKCSFCSSTKFWEGRIKFFSAKRVADEIEIMYKKYGYKNIEIYDDLFTFNKPRLREIISLLEKKKILGKINFSTMGRANCFDEELAVILKKLNVKKVFFGIETGSERMLKMLKDSINLEDDIKAVALCRKHGIMPGGLFMIGMPHETEEDMEATYQFIKKYLPNNYSLGQMSAYPNTPIWDYAVKNNLINPDMYEKKGRGFLEFNENLSLSSVPPQTLKKYWLKIKSINPKKNVRLDRIMNIRPRHIARMFSPLFIKKVYLLQTKQVKQD